MTVVNNHYAIDYVGIDNAGFESLWLISF